MNEIDSVKLAAQIRCDALKMVHRADASHIGGCLSCADILAHLYGKFLRVDPAHPDSSDRDRFILSKGHATAVVYSVLAELGFFPKEWLQDYSQDGTRLPGHIQDGIPGVEVSTGSLGHGLSIGVGMALAFKRAQLSNRVVVLLSDGDCDEGSTWEAVLMAPHLHLDNLLVVVDHNKLQALGYTKDVLPLHSLTDKWRAFGWAVYEIDGHNHSEIDEVLSAFPFEKGKPSVIIAHTIKGKGVSFMENQLAWHYKSPNDEELQKALKEINSVMEKDGNEGNV